MGIEVASEGIRIRKPLSELDKFVLEVVEILEKYADYVIVSEYVSILFGRSRGTEDIDFVVSSMSFEEFQRLHEEFEKKGLNSLIQKMLKVCMKYCVRRWPLGLQEGEKSFQMPR